MSVSNHDQPHAAGHQGYDRQDPNVRLIGLLAVATILFLIAVIFGLQFHYDSLHEQQVFVKVLEPESEQLQNLRAREDEELHSYKYLDRDKGIVRLPIERAMELLAQEYAAGKLKYPAAPYPVKPDEQGGPNAAAQ